MVRRMRGPEPGHAVVGAVHGVVAEVVQHHQQWPGPPCAHRHRGHAMGEDESQYRPGNPQAKDARDHGAADHIAQRSEVVAPIEAVRSLQPQVDAFGGGKHQQHGCGICKLVHAGRHYEALDWRAAIAYARISSIDTCPSWLASISSKCEETRGIALASSRVSMPSPLASALVKRSCISWATFCMRELSCAQALTAMKQSERRMKLRRMAGAFQWGRCEHFRHDVHARLFAGVLNL